MTDETNIIEIDANYSEYVIRSAASWAFSELDNFPKIFNRSNKWKLFFQHPVSAEARSKFDCYLNDYRLRELIDTSTNQDRQKIIARALRSIYQGEN